MFLVLALRIHITAEMNDALVAIGGFKTEHRGLIDVKVTKYYNNQFYIENKNVFQLAGQRIDEHFLANVSRRPVAIARRGVMAGRYSASFLPILRNTSLYCS